MDIRRNTMKDTGLKVETYVQPKTLSNNEGEEIDMACSREGQAKLDAKAGNIKNIDDVPTTPRELMDGINKTKQQY